MGSFYIDDDSNTVMGEAVTDAAAWYDSADWVGINATPHASLLIQAMLEPRGTDLDHLLVDYPVPIKGGPAISLKTVNWPKAFVVTGLTPVAAGKDPRATCLNLLAEHRVPKGTESKHFNSIKFFDHCLELWKKQRREQRRK